MSLLLLLRSHSAPQTADVPVVIVTGATETPTVTLSAVAPPIPETVITGSVVAPTVALGAVALSVTEVSVPSEAVSPDPVLAELAQATEVASVVVAGFDPVATPGAVPVEAPVATVVITVTEPSTGEIRVAVPAIDVTVTATAPLISLVSPQPAPGGGVPYSPIFIYPRRIPPRRVTPGLAGVRATVMAPAVKLGSVIATARPAWVFGSARPPGVRTAAIRVGTLAPGVNYEALSPQVSLALAYPVGSVGCTVEVIPPRLIESVRLVEIVELDEVRMLFYDDMSISLEVKGDYTVEMVVSNGRGSQVVEIPDIKELVG